MRLGSETEHLRQANWGERLRSHMLNEVKLPGYCLETETIGISVTHTLLDTDLLVLCSQMRYSCHLYW